MLGGGTSPFASKFGWALDNVYEFEALAPAFFETNLETSLLTSRCIGHPG
jgi:hypothetical protein